MQPGIMPFLVKELLFANRAQLRTSGRKIAKKSLPSTISISTIISLVLLLLPLFPKAQVMDYVDIHLTIREKVGDEIRAIPNARLTISDVGEVATDEHGQYVYPYPVRNQADPEISISMLSPERKLLKPLDGSVQIDPSQQEFYIDFLVVNMADESQEFQKKIEALENNMGKLQRENQLTKRQLYRLNNTLLDTILYFEQIRSSLEAQVSEMENLTEEQRQTIERQQSEIANLEAKVNTLTQDLTEALEERYLRQNEYFKAISSSLAGYVRHAKDLEEHLPHIKTYFGANDFRSMDRDARLYEKVFIEISDRQQEFLEGVARYWQNEEINKELEEVFDLLIKGIHLNQIRPTVNEIFDLISQGKPGKAQKTAEGAYEDISLNIRSLEKQINRILMKLRNS